MLKNRYEIEKKRVIDWYNNNEIINPIHITFTHLMDRYHKSILNGYIGLGICLDHF